jgi:hypothetical protein
VKPVGHFVPFYRLPDIVNFVVEVGVGLINQQSFKIEQDDFRIFPPGIIKVGARRISFEELVDIRKVFY